MKRKEFIGKLTYYERLNCSYYGNPRFYGEFTSESGEMLIGKTAVNAACAYGFFELSKRTPENHISYNPERKYHF